MDNNFWDLQYEFKCPVKICICMHIACITQIAYQRKQYKSYIRSQPFPINLMCIFGIKNKSIIKTDMCIALDVK